MKSSYLKGGGTAGAIITAIIGGIFLVEGGLVDHPDDILTNHGITETTARANQYEGLMSELSPELAFDIYYKDYILKPKFDLIIDLNTPVGTKVIDAGVNVGTRRAALWFQRSLNAVNRNGIDYPRITEDGLIGPQTIAAYKGLEKRRGKVEACKIMLKLMDGFQTTHYVSLTSKHAFTPGWIINRIGNVPLSDCEQV